MTKRFRLALKAGDRVYLNGALVRADRAVTLELLNEAVFLLDAYIMAPEAATTPLRQIYIEVQALLTDPEANDARRRACTEAIAMLKAAAASAPLRLGLTAVANHVAADRLIEALKTLRDLAALEDLQRAPTPARRSEPLA